MGLGSNKVASKNGNRSSVSWRANLKQVPKFEPKHIDEGRLHNVLTRVLAAGDYIGFGFTRDGGCYAVTVYSGDNKFTQYPRNEIEFNELLEAIADDYGPEGTPSAL